MGVKAMVYVGLFVVLLAIVQAWPDIYEPQYERWNRLSRRSDCTGSGGKCFSTHECCGGFVCAAFDDYFAGKEKLQDEDENPEIPGYCVKEKDLPECTSSLDCSSDSRCLTLSRTGDRYCVKRPRSQEPEKPSGSNRKYNYSSAKGGLGAECEDDSDCKAYTSDGSSKLCCQAINRGRQGIRKKCDRVRAISQCITK